MHLPDWWRCWQRYTVLRPNSEAFPPRPIARRTMLKIRITHRIRNRSAHNARRAADRCDGHRQKCSAFQVRWRLLQQGGPAASQRAPHGTCARREMGLDMFAPCCAANLSVSTPCVLYGNVSAALPPVELFSAAASISAKVVPPAHATWTIFTTLTRNTNPVRRRGPRRRVPQAATSRGGLWNTCASMSSQLNVSWRVLTTCQLMPAVNSSVCGSFHARLTRTSEVAHACSPPRRQSRAPSCRFRRSRTTEPFGHVPLPRLLAALKAWMHAFCAQGDGKCA